MRSAIALLGLPLLAGCFGSDPVEGIWIFYVSPEFTISGDTDCFENFHEGNCPDAEVGGDNPWTTSSNVERDWDNFVAQIVGTGGGEASLFAGGLIYDGAQNDTGEWVFTYSNYDLSESDRDHREGFHFNELDNQESSSSFELIFDGGSFTGDWVGTETYELSWGESDEWNAENIGVYDSELPSWTYINAGNDYSADDCEGDTCRLTLSGSTTTTVPVRAELTDVKDPSDFDALEAYGDFNL